MLFLQTDINVAINYSGCNEGKQMPTVFKIGVGAINRGASLEFCSQYAGEVHACCRLFLPSILVTILIRLGRD